MRRWNGSTGSRALPPTGWTGRRPARKIPQTLARAQPVNTPVVTLAVAQTALATWPPLEGFVQDGRYSYDGAQARADADLEAFQDPLVSVEWVTEDMAALPGRVAGHRARLSPR